MALLRGTTFTGIPIARTRVGAVPTAKVMTDVAKDDALNYELLTAKNAEGSGGASTNTAHGHNATDPGNLLFWPFATIHFGAGSAAEFNGQVNNVFDYSLETTSGTSVTAKFVLFYVMFYVPPAWLNQDIGVFLQGSWVGEPRITAGLYDAALSGPTGISLDVGNSPDGAVSEGGHDQWMGGNFSVSSAGVYVLEFWTDLRAVDESRFVHAVHVTPLTDSRNLAKPKAPAPQPATTTLCTVPSWQPLDDDVATANEALGAVVLLNAQNQNLLLETATDLPAPGNATRTQRGHNHDGNNSPGINYPVFSMTFGAPESPTGATLKGTNSNAPRSTTATFRDIGEIDLRTQISTNNVAATSKLKAAVMVYSDVSGGKTGFPQVQIESSTGAGPVQYYEAAGGYAVITRTGGEAALAFASGDFTTFTTRLANSTAGTAGPRILAMCMWFEQ